MAAAPGTNVTCGLTAATGIIAGLNTCKRVKDPFCYLRDHNVTCEPPPIFGPINCPLQYERFLRMRKFTV